MGAPLKEGDKRLGNQFWKLRSKHGRDKLLKSPELVWEAACEYFQWCTDNPILKEDYVGKDAERVMRQLPRPFTLHGLATYLDCDTETFNKLKEEKDFIDVYTRIRSIIYTQKFEGAAAGIFNHNIIARDLGLVEKKEDNVSISGVDPNLLKAIADRMNKGE